MTRALLVLAALLALVAVTPAVAQQRADFADIEDEVMCVSCNVALNIAESPQATQQKDFIRKLVDRGLTKQQVLDELVAVYGVNVLATPKTDDGVGLAAWLIPVVAALAGLGLLAVLLPRWRAEQALAGTEPLDRGAAGLSDEDARRLDEDLERFDR